MAFGKDLRTWLMRSLTPVVVLGIALAATAVTTLYVHQTNENRDEARFDAAVLEVEEAIETRITVYETILAATKGFIFSDRPPLTREEFERFIGELNLPEDYPGIQGIGYTVRVRNQEVPELEAFARRQGYSGFRVWPRTDAPFVHSILYLEPLDKRNAAAVGFDMSSNPIRREAMERAATTGETALSGPVTLVQEIEGPRQAGFLLYSPIYSGEPTTETERGEQLIGYAYIPVRADNFVRAAQGRTQINTIGLRIYDGAVASPERLIHTDPQYTPGRVPRFQAQRLVSFGGRTWTIEFWSRAGYERGPQRALTLVVAAIGLFVSLLLYVLALLLYRAWLRAAEQSADLQTSQATLATRERQLDTLLSNTPDIIARFDHDLRHLYINAAVEAATGMAPAQYIGKTNLELGMPESVVAEGNRGIRRVFETGEPVLIEFEFAGSTGRHVFQSSMVAERGPGGRIESVLSVTRDITALKLAEERLRSLVRHSTLLADASREFVEAKLDEKSIAAGATRVLTAQLAEMAGVFRYAAEGDLVVLLSLKHRVAEVERMVLESPVIKPFPRTSTAVIARVIETGVPAFITEADLAANAANIPATYLEMLRRLSIKSLILLPLKAEGRSQGVLAVGSESTLTREDFATCVELADRTALALENARLFQELHRAVRMRDEFLSIASHELKTPLTPLQLQMESLDRLVNRNEAIAPDRLAAIARITVRQVQRLTALVANLLDISRINEGRLALEPEPCDLGAIVDETVERFSAESERMGSTITVEKHGDLHGVWDRLRIEQVTTNLISNALKYGGGKPVEVYVAQQGASVELRVVDHGIGLDPEFIPHMFERFTRGVSGRSFGGLGLGLFIVNDIVRSHGGIVEARSGEGTTEFRVVLPARPESR